MQELVRFMAKNTSNDLQDHLKNTVLIAFKLLEKIGFSSKSLLGPVLFKDRPEGEKANGTYLVSKDSVVIFLPQRSHIALDIIWSIVHEIAHRVWHKGLTKDQRESWGKLVRNFGSKFSKEAIMARASGVKSGKNDPFWFWYSKNLDKSLSKFKKYLSTLNYISNGIPRDYALTSPEEAWADVVASMALGRSRNGVLLKRSSPLFTGFVRKIVGTISEEKDLKGLGKVIPVFRGPLYGEMARKVVIFDSKRSHNATL